MRDATKDTMMPLLIRTYSGQRKDNSVVVGRDALGTPFVKCPMWLHFAEYFIYILRNCCYALVTRSSMLHMTDVKRVAYVTNKKRISQQDHRRENQ